MIMVGLKRICLIAILLGLTTQSRSQNIALTFDDAPRGNGAYYTGIQRTRILIEKLRESGVSQVAFFVTTSQVDSLGRARLEAYGEAGHIIANHSHSHARIHRLGSDRFIEDIFAADAIIRNIPGFKPWFRYPFLDEGRTVAARDAIRKALAKKGYVNGYVTIDNYDWHLERLFQERLREGHVVDITRLRVVYLQHIWNSITFYDDIAQKVLGRSPDHVLLLHENDLAALFIGDLIKLIRSKGGEIVSPEEAYRDAIAAEVPDVLMNNQGRIAAIAKARGYRGPLRQESEEADYLLRLFNDSVQ